MKTPNPFQGTLAYLYGLCCSICALTIQNGLLSTDARAEGGRSDDPVDCLSQADVALDIGQRLQL